MRELSRSLEERAEIYSLNPSFLGIQKDLGLKVATGSGFSILEGLLRRRCEQLDDNGKLRSGYGPISLPHRTVEDGDRLFLFDALQLWMNHNAEQVVKETLDEMDDVTRYDVAKLTEKFRGFRKEHTEHDNLPRGSLLKAIKEHRNYNIHGEDSTMALGAIVLTLCCLILWDELTEDDIQFDMDKVKEEDHWPDVATYSEERDDALVLIKRHQQMLDNGFWSVPTDGAGLPRDRLTPRVFYPIPTSLEPYGIDLEW